MSPLLCVLIKNGKGAKVFSGISSIGSGMPFVEEGKRGQSMVLKEKERWISNGS